MTEERTYEEIVGTIKDAVVRKRTVTFYIRTDQNHLVMVGIDAGRIVTLSSGARRGQKALAELVEMQWGHVRTEDTAMAYSSHAIPPTATILASLEAGAIGAEMGRAGTSSGIDSSIKLAGARPVLRRLLGEYIGPIAPMISEEVLEPFGDSITKDDLRSAIAKMASEIDTIDESEAFAQKARAELGV